MTLLEFLQYIFAAIGIGAIGFALFMIFIMWWCDYYAWQKQASVPRPVLAATETIDRGQS